MGYLDEYKKLKKKRSYLPGNETVKNEGTKTDSPYLKTYNKLKAEKEAEMQKIAEKAKKSSNNKVTVTTSKEKEEEKERTWFNSGLFDDGYQFGDVSKTILGSVGDIAEDALTGVIGMGEQALDAMAFAAPYFVQGQYYQNGGAYQPLALQKANEDLFKQSKKDTEEFIEKDLYDEKEVAKKLLSNVTSAVYMSNIAQGGGFATTQDWQMAQQMQADSRNYLDNDMETASVFGDKSDSLVQSAGQLAGTMALQGLGIPWWLTTGATSFGSEIENALNQGATLEEAGLSAAITAGAEILTEKLSGGISFGGKTLDDALTNQLARSISNKFVRNGLKIGMDFVGEGTEEVLSSAFSNLGSALYKEENIGELLTSEEAIDEYIESFIGGGILGGVSSTGKAIKDTVSGKDYASGLTNNEKAVVDKVYNDAIAEQEADGKKLTERQKSKIYDDTLKALEKGYIDTDTIESVIGGETYNTYKSIIEQEDALKKEYEELGNTQNPTLAQTSRYNALEQQIKEMKEKSNRTQLREQLDNEMFGLVQGSKLSESYNEKARSKQKFEADLDSYTNENAKQTVKNFMEKTKANNTNRAHDYVDFLTRISEDRGHTFDFTTTEQLEKSIANGNPYNITEDPKRIEAFVTGKGKTIVINMDANKSLSSLVGHETSHTFEKDGGYDELQKVLFRLAETKGEYADRLASIQRRYSKLSEAEQKKELTADLLGDYIFTDTDFIRSLSTEKPNILKRIYNEIKYLYKMATAGSKEARELERVKREIEKIWRENEASNEAKEVSDTETKYSIREEAPPKETGIAYKVFFVKDGKLYPPMVANPDGADTPMGVWLNADVGTAAPDSKTGRPQVKAGGKGTQGGSGSLAFRPGWHLGDLPRASQFDRVNPETGKKELFPENFVWAEVEYAKDVDYQEEAMSYGYTDNGKFRHAYAGLPRLPENGYYRYRTNPKPDTVPWVITGAMKVNRLLSDAEVNAILEKNGVPPVHRQGGDVGLEKFGFNEDGSVKYSLSDSKNTGADAFVYLTNNLDSQDVTTMLQEVANDLSYYGNHTELETHLRSIADDFKTMDETALRDLYERICKVYDEEGKDFYWYGFALNTEDGIKEFTNYRIEQEMGAKTKRYNDLLDKLFADYGNLDKNALWATFGEKLLKGQNTTSLSNEEVNSIVKEIQQLREEIQNYTAKENVKYSLSDSDGKQLTKEQQEYFKDSKVRDENGNLKVMYHGTNDGGFHEFKPFFADDGASLFFVDDNEVAKSYSGTHDTYAPKTLKTAEDVNAFLAEINETDYEVREENGEFVLYDAGDEVATSDTADGIFEEYRDYTGNGYGGTNYKVYLNIKNPLVVDAKDNNWNELADFDPKTMISYEYFHVMRGSDGTFNVEWLDEANPYGESEVKYGMSLEEIESKFGSYVKDRIVEANRIETSIENVVVDKNTLELIPNSTRQYSYLARKNGYDGVIFNNIVDNGVFASGIHRFSTSTVAIAFDSNQVKSVANANPTQDPDIRFSLSETVEETKDLIALHNLTGTKLMKALKLGGLPMPSVAIARAKEGHSEFGEISLVLNKSAIDPQTNRNNKLYSGDAWTPTYPRVEYKANDTVRRKLSEKFTNLVPYDIQDELGHIYLDSENLTDKLNRNDGDIVEVFGRNDAMKYAYLLDTGTKITLPMKEKRLSYSSVIENGAVIRVAEAISAEELNKAASSGSGAVRELEPIVRKAVAEYMQETYGSDPKLLKLMMPDGELSFSELDGYVTAARKYNRTGIEQTVDRQAARELLNSQINQTEYEEWLKEQFAGIVEKEGIRNNKDFFTPSGNSRSFEALHYEHNLDNVIKAMRETGEKGIGFGGGNIFGASTTEFSSIDDMKQSTGRLQNISKEEYQKIKDGISDRFFEIAKQLPNDKNSYSATSDATEVLIEAVTKYKTRSGIANYIRKELQGWGTYSEQTVDDLMELVDDIRKMPTGYFEAKPQRAVGFDEVGVFVIPYDADVKLKQELLNRGYSIAEYDPKVEGDRKRVVNQFEQYMFSLSETDIAPSPYGSYNVFKDIALEQNIAPTEEQTAAEVEPFTQDYGPLTEAEANVRDDEQVDRHYFLDDMAPEPEEMYNGTFAEHLKPADPFYERDIKEVGKRNVNAYMYENPEVKPFFQQEALVMLGELNNSVKGEKYYNDQLYYDTNGEMGWFGTTRYTSDDIAYLLDSFNYTYKDVEKGLRAIIEDNGKENNAISKRIEFLLDERLRTGYTEFMFGDKIPPNQDYVNLLMSKEITEYNDDAWNNWLRNLTPEEIQQYFSPREELAPPAEYVAIEPESPVTESAPVTEEAPLYEDATGQQTMFEVEDAETEPTVTRSGLHGNIIKNIKNVFTAKGFNFDDVLKKAKNLSTFATVDNTPQRVMEKALGYKQGQILSDLTVNQVAQNETEGTRWLNSFTDRKNGLLAQISKQYHIKPGSKESAAAQMYAEGFYVNEENEIIAYGDAELAKDFPSPRVQANIKGLAGDTRIRQIYDETLRMINDSRTRNAYPEIPRLDNYFLHFRAMDDTFSRLGLPFNPNDIRAKDLPTDLNGVTADLKPGQPYFASQMHRTGKRTSFDLLGGLERYLTSAKNQIYHIDDIQTLRALRNYIADTYGQAHGLESLDMLSEEEAQDRIEKVYGSHLSTFAKFLNEEANILAGKTALIDRGLEGIIGRRGITFLDTVNRQVGSNMVGFNLSSSLTNFLPVAQTFAKSNKADFVKAFAQTASNKIGSVFGRNDGFAEQSPVMIRRKGADRFYRTPFQKVGDTGYVIMSAVDDISTELIARTKYNELTRKGMDSQKAHYETDKWVSRLMGDRSLGQQPQLYNSKMLGLITKFQLEVRNQLDSQFYDTIQEAKVSNEDIQNGLARNAKTAAKVASTFVQLAVVQHLFGKAFESVAGYNPAFDIIEVLLKTAGYDDDEESEDTVLDNIEQGFLALLEDLPYTGTLTGGRIPISSALPIEQFVTGKDDYGNEKSRWETLGEVAPYYVLPTGYGQIKKSVQGLSMFDDELPIAGSYTDSGNLRFPVEDTLKNRVQAGVFGQWASDVAGDYFDNARNPLKEKQIEELIDLDMPIREYWDYREGLAEQETLEDKFEYIAGLDVSVEQKNIMINNVVDRKEKVDMSNYDDFASYEEFDFYSKNTEKYNFLQENGVSYSEYMSDKDAKEEYDNAYSWYKNNPEKVTVSKAITDNVIEYRRYTSDLNDIRADKDADGDSIAGSAKEKKIAYINGLDLDYGQRIILFRSYYDSKADKAEYNADIVDYLNSREDISYEEMVTILEELDFKVYPDGTIEW